MKTRGEQPGEESKAVDAVLDSELESADGAEEMVLRVAQEIGFPEEELHRLGMAVRETVVNAVVHGNRYSAHKKVRLQIFKAPDHISVTVADEGNGFDLASLPDPLAEENLLQQSGRGILLIRAFVDKFEMRRLVPRGTEVKLVKYLNRRSGEGEDSSKEV
ncbi:MAG TPA: ATP-binding protein [Bryobacteraceae bacterium]|jgi:serine/threonine-protein kinase RsbW|nr:ATP-binding protein [Bryobacteraceae bacterium]